MFCIQSNQVVCHSSSLNLLSAYKNKDHMNSLEFKFGVEIINIIFNIQLRNLKFS
jgi:hypothetical protein